MSPNYPQNYQDNLLCVWTVSVPSGDINLLISDMAIADGDVGCPSDGLFVRFLYFANHTKCHLSLLIITGSIPTAKKP